jgi:membrane protein DedA with SNARE-associated domain
VYLGYFGANRHEWLVMWVRRGQSSLWVLGGLAVLIVLALWWRHRRRRACREAGFD